MALYDVCGDDPGAFVNDDCQTYMGQVRSLLLVPASEWEGLDREDGTALQALIDSNLVYNLAKVSGEYTEPEAATVDGMGDDNTRLVSKTHTLTVMHNVIRDNATFWNTIQRRRDFYVGWRVGELGDTENPPFMMWSTATVSIVASPPVPLAKTDMVTFRLTITWKSINNPEMLDAPQELFSAAA